MEGELTEYYDEEPLVAKIVYSMIPSIDLLTGSGGASNDL
jgi:hypothetical protein